MKNNFLSICLGISLVLVSAGFLIRSAYPAKAAPPMPSAAGKYQLSVVSHNGKLHAWVLDTETGKSSAYYFSTQWLAAETKLGNIGR